MRSFLQSKFWARLLLAVALVVALCGSPLHGVCAFLIGGGASLLAHPLNVSFGANAYPTMLDVAKINGSDAVVGLIEENLNVAPEITIFPARTINGTSFKTLLRTALPSTQFRNANEGVSTTKSSYANKLVECFYLDGKMEIDVAVAQADDQGEEHAKMIEADGHAQAAILHLGKQVWYGTGTGGDAKGFPGASQLVDSSYVLDAGGTTATTGSSVYGVRVGPKHASMIFGRDTVLSLGEWSKQRITRSNAELTAWINSLEGWLGMQWINKDSVCRLKDITADSGMTCTDAKLAQLLSQLKWVPDYWFMTRRSRYQLQVSRTPTSNTSGESSTRPIAPLPTESNGIPIVVTDSLLNTEALT